MRLKIDVYFDGDNDFDDMSLAISNLTLDLWKNYREDIDKNSATYVFPLGSIRISNEPNPVDPNEFEDCDDNDNSTSDVQS